MERRWAKGLPSKGVERGRKLNDRHMAGLLVVERKLDLMYVETLTAACRIRRRRIEAMPALSLADAAVAEAAQVAAHVLFVKESKRNRDDTPKREGRVLAMHKLDRMYEEAHRAARRRDRRKMEAAAAGGATKEEETTGGGGKKRKKEEWAPFVAADHEQVNSIPGVMYF